MQTKEANKTEKKIAMQRRLKEGKAKKTETVKAEREKSERATERKCEKE